MSSYHALVLLRQVRTVLQNRGHCAMWVPGIPAVCLYPADHPGACGRPA